MPAGAIDAKNRFWKRKDWAFLFPGKALAKIFRGRLLARLRREGCMPPAGMRRQEWVVNCRGVGSGEPALKYLSRYLYRGVIAEKQIVANQDGQVTFLFRDSETKAWKSRTMPGEDFLLLVLQHVLPQGFRRVRDFGFLHGNARRLLRLVQYLLRAKPPVRGACPRPAIRCPACQAVMVIVATGIRRAAPSTGPPG